MTNSAINQTQKPLEFCLHTEINVNNKYGHQHLVRKSMEDATKSREPFDIQ